MQTTLREINGLTLYTLLLTAQYGHDDMLAMFYVCSTGYPQNPKTIEIIYC